jgi:uncharacterized protein (TIGR03083 family)
MPDNERVGVAYGGVRARVTEIMRAADPAALDAIALATPEWRVRDVLAHLVGVSADAVAGNLDGVATEPWTRAQVDARRDASIDDMLAEWAEIGSLFEAALADVPFEMSGQALFDAVTHEHDIRAALGVPGARDADAVGIAWGWILGARTRGNAPCICYVTEDGKDVSGVGDIVATVEAPRFEIVRAVTGRRTTEEITRYGWDPEPRVDLILGNNDLFTLRETPLGE